MKYWRWIFIKPLKAFAVLSILIITVAVAFTACVPADATQTVATPAPPRTQGITPSRQPQPSATPQAASGPSVSPNAGAIIPIPGETKAPTGLPSPSVIPTPSTPTVNIDLTSQNLKFDKDTITAKAGSQVNINFNNKDSGIYNNFSVYKDEKATQSIFVGDQIIGPNTITYT